MKYLIIAIAPILIFALVRLAVEKLDCICWRRRVIKAMDSGAFYQLPEYKRSEILKKFRV